MVSLRYKALYFLDHAYFKSVYDDQERADIASRVDIVGGLLTREDYFASSQCWPEVDLIFAGWEMVEMDKNFLRRFPSLKAIFYGAGSVKALTTDVFWDRDILITSAYAANAIPVAEFTLSQIFFSLKRGWQHTRWIRQHRRFPAKTELPGAGAFQSTVGLLSLGMAGRLVARHLQNFDLDVLVYDPLAPPETADELGITLVSLDEIFTRCDVVSCHTPLLPETAGMIRGRHFEIMKPEATFINTARGRVVNEAEMIECLKRRPDLLAVLDVTYPEPPVEDSPLYTLDNVVLTPHLAGSLGRECRRMGRMMVEELDRFLAGKPLRYAISRERALILA